MCHVQGHNTGHVQLLQPEQHLNKGQPLSSQEVAGALLSDLQALLLQLSLAFSQVLIVVECTPGVEYHVTQRGGMLQMIAKSLGVKLLLLTSACEAQTQVRKLTGQVKLYIGHSCIDTHSSLS